MPKNQDGLSAAATANLITTLAAAMKTTNQATPPRRTFSWFPRLRWVVLAVAVVIMAYAWVFITESPPTSTGSFNNITASCDRIPFLDPYENVFSIIAHDMTEFVPEDDDTKDTWQDAVDSVRKAAGGLNDAAEVYIENRRHLLKRLKPLDVSLQIGADALEAVLEEPPPTRWQILIGPWRPSGPTKGETLVSIDGRVLDAVREVSSAISSDWKNLQKHEAALAKQMQEIGDDTLECLEESIELLEDEASDHELGTMMILMRRSQNIFMGLPGAKRLASYVSGKDGRESWLAKGEEMALEAIMKHHVAVTNLYLAHDTTSTFLQELEDWENGNEETDNVLRRIDSQVQVFLRRAEHLESTRHAITVDQLRESLRMAAGFVTRLQVILELNLQLVMATWGDAAGYHWVDLCSP